MQNSVYKQPDLHKTHRTSHHHQIQNLNLHKMTKNNQPSSFKNKSVLVLDMNLKTKKQLVYELLELGSDAPEKLILWNQENAKKPIIDSIRTRQRSECSVSESAVNESDVDHHQFHLISVYLCGKLRNNLLILPQTPRMLIGLQHDDGSCHTHQSVDLLVICGFQ